MTTLEKIQELEKKQLKIAKAISTAKRNLKGADKAADTHVKAAIGGAVLALFEKENLPNTIRGLILRGADLGIQKQGLGREKFESLKARFLKQTGEQE